MKISNRFLVMYFRANTGDFFLNTSLVLVDDQINRIDDSFFSKLVSVCCFLLYLNSWFVHKGLLPWFEIDREKWWYPNRIPIFDFDWIHYYSYAFICLSFAFYKSIHLQENGKHTIQKVDAATGNIHMRAKKAKNKELCQSYPLSYTIEQCLLWETNVKIEL